MATQEKTWNVANRLHSLKDSDNPEVNHIIAGADEIYDDTKGAKQSDINAKADAALADRYTKAETYSKEQLDSMITTPDVEYVTVATFADLPQTGEADTIYRVSSYDGAQVDASKYALYAWNGATYQLLAVRSAVGEVFDVSEYNSGDTYETLAAALAAVPESVQRGGMSIKFISGNKYVQNRYMGTVTNAATFANVANWQGIDNEPTAGSDNLVKSGGVAAVNGYYNENPEFVKLDSEGKVLWGIQTNGNVVFGAGVPQQIKDYIREKIDELSLDEYEDIVDFLNDIEKGDKTFQTLLNEKVDKEEGKSLIDSGYASSKYSIENPEFIDVIIDAENKVIEGIKNDGTKVVGGNLNVGGSANILGNMEVYGVSYTVIENPEYLAAWVDADNNVIFGIKADGKTYVGDANFLDDIKDIKAFIASIPADIDWEALLSTTAVENPELIEAKTDSEGKLLAGRTPDGAAFESVGFSTPKTSIGGHTIENIEDPEERTEILTDSEGKIISYRDAEGVLHENAGIATKSIAIGSIECSDEAVSDLISILKDHEYGIVGHDMSDDSFIQIAEPNLAVMNVSNISAMPTTKTTNGHAIIEVWDGNGNYFKKKAIINAQGNSSLAHAKKNFALDWCEDDWEGDETTSIKIGKWVTQDSHHFKAYYTDFFVGIPVIAYQLFNDMVLTRGVYSDRAWKRALLPDNETIGVTNVSMEDSPLNLLIDTGARCFPDGFPVIVYLNGEFYGIFSWQLKKHRDNYHQVKDNGNHIHLDGNICPTLLWDTDGSINWKKWAGLLPESEQVQSTDGIEIRNPKKMVLRNGGEYDFDTIHALDPSTAEDADVEPVCDEDDEWDALVEGASSKLLARLNYTNLVKKSILNLSTYMTTLKSMRSGSSTDAQIKEYFEEHFDVASLIDFTVFCDITGNVDGMKKNWQWNTWDGTKWFCSPYDLDWTFGLRGGRDTVEPANAHLATSQSNPCWWVITYYQTELEARYAELRECGVLDGERIAKELNNWVLRIGFDNYKNESKKWPDKMVDNIYRFRNWANKSIENMDSVYNYNN